MQNIITIVISFLGGGGIIWTIWDRVQVYKKSKLDENVAFLNHKDAVENRASKELHDLVEALQEELTRKLEEIEKKDGAIDTRNLELKEWQSISDKNNELITLSKVENFILRRERRELLSACKKLKEALNHISEKTTVDVTEPCQILELVLFRLETDVDVATTIDLHTDKHRTLSSRERS